MSIFQIDFGGGIQIWGTNPALIWTSDLHEEEGIPLHAYTKDDAAPVIDETYSQVTIDGIALDPLMVRVFMAQSAMPSLTSRVVTADCPRCSRPHFATGHWAFTPLLLQKCQYCGKEFSFRGKLRKVVCNPLFGMVSELAKLAPRGPQEHDLGLLPETL